MHFNHYGGAGAELAADLANAAPTAAGIGGVLRSHGTRGADVDAAQAAALAEWAGLLRAVFGQADIDEQVRLVNDLLDRSATRPFVSQHDGRPPHLHHAAVDDDVVERMRAHTAGGLAHAICDGGATRLGRCARAGCGVVYVDTSRNGRRRFCSLRCANRVRVADSRGRRNHGEADERVRPEPASAV